MAAIPKHELEEGLRQHVEYALKKSDRKRVRKGLAAYGSVIGMGAGGASATVVVSGLLGASAAVTAATPVGWALGACAAAVGLGFLIYKGGRTLHKFLHCKAVANDFLDGLKTNHAGVADALGELGILVPWAKAEIEAGREAEVKARIKEQLRNKRERMAEGIYKALTDGTDEERQQATEILAEGYQIDPEYIRAAIEDGDRSLVDIVKKKLSSW